ncbi:MAG: hypothetical protein RL463_853 [Bacteroidota bacterium]
MDNNQILKNKYKLVQAAKILKTEFVGLDEVIDEIINLIMPWYLFPEAQLRPLLVNVWGLTGTGKSALLKRLATLMEADNSYIHIDMGEHNSEKGAWLKEMFTDELVPFDGKPVILCLDEFQFARTLDEDKKEINKDKLRVIWELIDTGKIYHSPSMSSYVIKLAANGVNLIDKAIKRGVLVEQGKVIAQEKEFLALFGSYYLDHYERYSEAMSVNYFLSKDFIDGLRDLYEAENDSPFDEWHKKVQNLDLYGIAELLIGGIEKRTTLKQMDLSKALIFVVGNLDEAFYMSHNLNPDISADDFYTAVKKVNIGGVKAALKKRFRNEQVARLGNNHLIYPCFNTHNYELFISKQLDKVSAFVKERFSIDIQFHDSVKQVIYREGVFPSQGARPVLTTINNLVESYVSKIIVELLEKNIVADNISWEFHEDTYVFHCRKKDALVHNWSTPLNLKMNKLRKATNSDVQAHTAVHEAGHAVLAAICLKIVPKLITTKTVSNECEGFCQVDMPEGVLTKELIVKDIMITLGGFIAEKLVFGEQQTSSGVSGDIEEAARLAHEAIKEYGMGSMPLYLSHSTKNINEHFVHNPKFEDEAIQLIVQCEKEAEQILKRNKLALLKIAENLTSNSQMKTDEIEAMMKQYATELWINESGFIKKENYFNFKELIQEQITALMV